MENLFLNLLDTQGIWTALSIALIFYILKKEANRDIRQEMREVKYQSIIMELTEKFDLLNDLKMI